MAKSKLGHQTSGKIVMKTRYLTFKVSDNGLYLAPTKEGTAEAKEMLERQPRRGSISEQGDMLEEAMGNGWDYVNPEDVGALTDATIISNDGFIADDGKWYAHPHAKRAVVFAHMNYAVEDPIETWADGKPVFLVKDGVTVTPEYRKLIQKKWDDTNG